MTERGDVIHRLDRGQWWEEKYCRITTNLTMAAFQKGDLLRVMGGSYEGRLCIFIEMVPGGE